MDSTISLNFLKEKSLICIMNSLIRNSYNNNSYSEIYRARSVTKFEARALDNFLFEIGKPSPRILDFGCGTAKPYDVYLARKSCIITGVDFSINHVKMAKQNLPEANFIYSDFMKYQDNKIYDGVVMLYSLFHVQRKYHKQLLEKVYSKINDKGLVLLNVRRKESGEIKYKKNFCGKPMLWSNFDYKTFKSFAKEVGFKTTVLGDEKDYGSEESHIWILLKKQ